MNYGIEDLADEIIVNAKGMKVYGITVCSNEKVCAVNVLVTYLKPITSSAPIYCSMTFERLNNLSRYQMVGSTFEEIQTIQMATLYHNNNKNELEKSGFSYNNQITEKIIQEIKERGYMIE